MNEVCVENCAIKRDCSAFEEKPNLKLSDMPHFPLKESAGMTKEERFTSVTIYLAKVVDHLQGKEDVPETFVGQAPRSRRINREIVKIAKVLNTSKDERLEK